MRRGIGACMSTSVAPMSPAPMPSHLTHSLTLQPVSDALGLMSYDANELPSNTQSPSTTANVAGCAMEALVPMDTTEPVAAPKTSVHVLAVDDDPSVRQMIADYLGDNDIRVSTLPSGRGVDEAIEREGVDLLILDLKMPGEDGMQIVRRLRERWDLPVIMLTGRKEEADRVMGLELGADDYLTKPFSPRELLARIRALLRRSRARETVAEGLARIRIYRFSGWDLNTRLRRLTSPDGETVATTNSEFNLLVAFLSAPQRVLSREQLLNLSRLHNDEVYDRSIDVQVGRLRRKLEPEGTKAPLIRTERGAGYVFTADVEVIR